LTLGHTVIHSPWSWAATRQSALHHTETRHTETIHTCASLIEERSMDKSPPCCICAMHAARMSSYSGMHERFVVLASSAHHGIAYSKVKSVRLVVVRQCIRTSTDQRLDLGIWRQDASHASSHPHPKIGTTHWVSEVLGAGPERRLPSRPIRKGLFPRLVDLTGRAHSRAIRAHR
jgi:hypothetical protein